MSWTAPIEPINITARITNNNAWTEVDLGTNDDVPVGTKLIILKVRLIGLWANDYNAAVRPTGSSFDPPYQQENDTIVTEVIQLDTNRKFEAKVDVHGSYTPSFSFHIVAYHTSNTLLSIPVNKSLGTWATYVLQSDASLPATAKVAAILAVKSSTGYSNQAFRPYGATYDYYKSWARYFGNNAVFVGLDAQQQWEQKAEQYTIDAYLLGYLPDAEWVSDNPIDIESAQGSYVTVDLSAQVPANAVAAIIQFISASEDGAMFNARHPDSIESMTSGCGAYLARMDVCALNEAKVIVVYVSSNANAQVHLVGWLLYMPSGGVRTFPIPNPKTVWQSQSGKRTFPLIGEQEV